MCGRVCLLSADEFGQVLHALRHNTQLQLEIDMDSVSERRQARPTSTVYAICPQNALLDSTRMTWGYNASWSDGPLFNTRIEQADKPGSMWRESFERGRCILPVAAFFEQHETEKELSPQSGRPIKRPYRFMAADGAPLLLACVSAESRLSVVTCEPNKSVAPIHKRMPLVLKAKEAGLWLGDAYRELSDRSLIDLAVCPEHEDAGFRQETLF